MLQRLVIRVSKSWRLYLLVVVLFVLALRALLMIGEVFSAHSRGIPPFDLQNGLVASDVEPQIAAYTARARELYLGFTAVDFAFPFLGGLLVAASAAFLLRRSLPAAYGWLEARRLLPIFFLATLFDWLENLAAIALIYISAGESAWLPLALVTAKRLKLACVFAGQGFVGLAFLYTAGSLFAGGLARRRGKRPVVSAPVTNRDEPGRPCG